MIGTLIKTLTKQGSNVVEIGANYGQITIQIAHHIGTTGHVWAFEPIPDAVKRINFLLKIYRFNNVEVIQKCLWNKVTTKQFYVAGSLGYSSLLENYVDKCIERGVGDFNSNQAYTIDVEVTTLDHLFHGKETIDLIKCDAQGADVDILMHGGKKILQDQQPHLIFEYPREILSEEVNNELYNFLVSLRYELYMYDGATDSIAKISQVKDLWILDGWDVIAVNPDKYQRELNWGSSLVCCSRTSK